MNKYIVSKGKTVKEAVNTALDLLNAAHSDVDIEIIEPETKGILGIGAKPAVVRVTNRTIQNAANASFDPVVSLESLKNIVESMEFPKENQVPSPVVVARKADESDLFGKVWVRDGQIFSKDAPDKYPLVSPAKGMNLYQNEVLVEKTVIIGENDILQVELQDDKHDPTWELKISDNKMEAILKVTPGKVIRRKLKDMPPSNNIQLEVDERIIPIMIETGPIMDKLKGMGIVHGVEYSEIARACISEEAGSFIIAKGTPPTPGKHGYFEPVQEVEIKKGVKERSDGTIDYREIQEFPSADRGQLIGIVCPPIPGFPGLAVTNEYVFPPEVYPLSVNAGKGIVLVDGGTKVVATDAGHPEVKIKGQLAKISVIPKLTLGKDVDFQTGNVHFIGDIEVLGSVQDGMTLEAQGNVIIRNNVNMAKITAGNSIIIQNNVITSEITAGKSNLLKAEISQILGELIEQMKQMSNAINQLSTVSAFKVSSFARTGLGPLIKILCDGKFKSFHPLTMTVINKINSGAEGLGGEWLEFGEQMNNAYMKPHISNLQSIEDVVRMIKMAEELYASTQNPEPEENCFIKAGFAHNSQMYSSGNIIIVGQGIYNSKLHAGGFIEVDGFVRGGDIYASKGVRVGEAGAKGGIVTKITVPQSETIKIKAAMADTVIQIGTKTHRFMDLTFNVFARIDEDGQLIIS
ncbi:MAG: hypothetical protein JWM44_1356 [Bacilli bacterium]|nr:hypothetical protein [Bacilli bacterium]